MDRATGLQSGWQPALLPLIGQRRGELLMLLLLVPSASLRLAGCLHDAKPVACMLLFAYVCVCVCVREFNACSMWQKAGVKD